MREIRLSGLEGGVAARAAIPTPITGFILPPISRRCWTRRYSSQRDEFNHPQTRDAPLAMGPGCPRVTEGRGGYKFRA